MPKGHHLNPGRQATEEQSAGRLARLELVAPDERLLGPPCRPRPTWRTPAPRLPTAAPAGLSPIASTALAARSFGHIANAIDRLDLNEADEERELITGLVGDVLFVERSRRKRIISARKATHREQIDYEEANAPSRSGNR